MKFHLEDATLTITFQGIERLWVLKRQLVIPRVSISRMGWQETFEIPRAELGWRLGGTALPGSIWAGRFLGRAGHNFLYLTRTRGLFDEIQAADVLTLELHDFPYHHLFFTVSDPAMADSIMGWWGAAS